MHTEIQTEEDTMLVYLSGEIDHHAAGASREKIDTFIAAFVPKQVILDFQQVTFMDSAGIGLVMGRYKLLQAYNCPLCIRNLSPHAYKVMRLAGLEKIAVLQKRKEGKTNDASKQRNEITAGKPLGQ